MAAGCSNFRERAWTIEALAVANSEKLDSIHVTTPNYGSDREPFAGVLAIEKGIGVEANDFTGDLGLRIYVGLQRPIQVR